MSSNPGMLLHLSGAIWCNYMKVMANINQSEMPKGKTSRASVSFPAELYLELEKLAKQKKVSVAWIVRDAAEKYVASEYPLFGNQ